MANVASVHSGKLNLLKNLPIIGFVHPGYASESREVLASLRLGLQDMRLADGQQVRLVEIFGEANKSQLLEKLSQLVAMRPRAVIAAGESAQLVKGMSSSLPIVNITGGDPVRQGLVSNLAHPGGNVTAVSFMTVELGPKRAELLITSVPEAKLIVSIEDPTSGLLAADGSRNFDQLASYFRSRSIDFMRTHVSNRQEIGRVLQQAKDAGAQGLIIGTSPTFTSMRRDIVDAANKLRLPTIYPHREFVAAGGLMSYGANIREAYRQAGQYAGRILQGENPGNIPIVLPTSFELTINEKAAQQIGLTLPSSLLALADELVQ